MNQEQWTAVDSYINTTFALNDSALERVLRTTTEAGMPEIHVAPNQGKMLQLLALSCRAKNILEIGTLGGYSTICLARGVADGGKLITLEFEEKHARVAKGNIDAAGLGNKVEIILGRASDSLARLADQKRGPFDLIFIDADKEGYPDYLNWSLKLSRPGTLIIADNVVRDGDVINPKCEDSRVQGVRKFNQMLANDKRLVATVLQCVGAKGYDGLAFAVVQPQ